METVRTTYKSKNKRQTKDTRKKGMPKWKNVLQEIETLEARLKIETPPQGTLYYKYKPEGQDAEAKQTLRKVIETSDKSQVKIRFSDLPISKATTSGLFKSKFVRMTEV